MNCKHKHGDNVSTYWLCGQCYSKLPDRPVKYVMRRATVGDGDFEGKVMPERQIPIYAPIKVADGGHTLSAFVKAIASRLVVMTRGSMGMDDATDYAVSLLESIDEEFGVHDFDWSTSGAWEIVDEDMQHWDFDSPSGN